MNQTTISDSTDIGRSDTTAWREFRRGAQAIIPLIAGAIPFGIIFGTLSVNAGLSVAATLAMSLLVFAGSAQFIASGMVAGGCGVAHHRADDAGGQPAPRPVQRVDRTAHEAPAASAG